ncbi:acetate uptake transporter family protein [Gandjariella thermophila]|uniref:Uncharacterized protein n=1 Tax=Gandjariella thermophila TaxID=1931992 RepID=A0A4D4J014_9PSEU|nr:GPR1/FUN34/YaaH family transporter [Gandjariella thermophila]GDY28402.1 hypothetical protein GTS_00350 [Gandjariella thermophila]
MTHASAEQAPSVPGQREAAEGRDVSFWRSHTQISLQPVAAPSILGLYGLAGATFMVAANLAGWYGGPATPLVLFPFAFFFGGLAQFLAGMWSFRARDGLATAVHGMWGAFWLAFGLYSVITLWSPVLFTAPGALVGAGYWFIVLAAVTWMCALAAVPENLALSATLVVLAVAATILAIGWTAGIGAAVPIAGNLFVAAAVLAFYTASAMLLQGTLGRVVLPIGGRGRANRPGMIPSQPIQYELGEPGVKVGQ